jgi:hypothetical protein
MPLCFDARPPTPGGIRPSETLLKKVKVEPWQERVCINYSSKKFASLGNMIL